MTNVYNANTRRVVIVANTVFEREDLPNLEQAEQWIQPAQASAIEFGFRQGEIILLKDKETQALDDFFTEL